jgi:hypothetical protein
MYDSLHKYEHESRGTIRHIFRHRRSSRSGNSVCDRRRSAVQRHLTKSRPLDPFESSKWLASSSDDGEVTVGRATIRAHGGLRCHVLTLKVSYGLYDDSTKPYLARKTGGLQLPSPSGVDGETTIVRGDMGYYGRLQRHIQPSDPTQRP